MTDAGIPIPRPITRRRAVLVLAAAAGLPLAASAPLGELEPPLPVFRWRGRVLGVDAEMAFTHPDRLSVRRAVAASLAEVSRLERIFSLHDPASEISRLNRTGRLAHPSPEMRTLLGEASRLGAISGGAFDVTVQPLWQLHRACSEIGRAPQPSEIAEVLGRVDYRRVEVGAGEVRLALPGAAVTLNGIAQGFITERVAKLLGDLGFERVVLQLGETFALASPDAPAGPVIGIRDPFAAEGLIARARIANLALATSAGGETPFPGTGGAHHLFDPRVGRSARRLASVSVIARSATLADALSTALFVAPPEKAPEILRAGGGLGALLVHADGTRHKIGPAGERLFS